MCQCIIRKLIMLFDEEYHFDKYLGRLLISGREQLVNQEKYTGKYALFLKAFTFQRDEDN